MPNAGDRRNSSRHDRNHDAHALAWRLPLGVDTREVLDFIVAGELEPSAARRPVRKAL